MDKTTVELSIEKLKKGLTNKHITEAQKEAMKVKMAELQAKLADLEKEEEKSDEPESKEPGTTEPKAAKGSANKTDKPSVAASKQSNGGGSPSNSASDSAKLQVKVKKKPKEHKESFKNDCAETLAKVRVLLGEHHAKKPAKKSKPATKKRTSEVLADGISQVAGRAIKRELTLDKVVKIKVSKLRDARDKFAEGLAAMRSALGGISSENDSFIKDFTKQFNDWIAEVEDKQKQAQSKQAA